MRLCHRSRDRERGGEGEDPSTNRRLANRTRTVATNTSSISITKLAAATKRPQQPHRHALLQPGAVMALVEAIRGLQTNDATVEAAERAGEAS